MSSIAHLSVDDVDGLGPFLFHDPMLDNTLEISNHCRIVEIHVRTTVPLDELVYSLRFEICLRHSETSVWDVHWGESRGYNHLIRLEEMS